MGLFMERGLKEQEDEYGQLLDIPVKRIFL
jgi:hypothetical protein